jgi:hypothetical protein
MTTELPPGGDDIAGPGGNMNSSSSDDDELSYSRPIHPHNAPSEERIQITKDSSVGPTDVLCGRGKTSFNHCK